MLNDPQLRSDLHDVVAAQADAEGNRQNNYGLAIENQRALNPYYLLGLDRNDNRTCRMVQTIRRAQPGILLATLAASTLQSYGKSAA